MEETHRSEMMTLQHSMTVLEMLEAKMVNKGNRSVDKVDVKKEIAQYRNLLKKGGAKRNERQPIMPRSSPNIPEPSNLSKTPNHENPIASWIPTTPKPSEICENPIASLNPKTPDPSKVPETPIPTLIDETSTPPKPLSMTTQFPPGSLSLLNPPKSPEPHSHRDIRDIDSLQYPPKP
ncbi:hypothetical protein WMY93_027020 [Mugilogobius chulae]|uniref:Uncharacterized protein n=1 Tax=Mugilogobius chulae TaxID=88201 RepID=A0AAW0MW54_9GOBI